MRKAELLPDDLKDKLPRFHTQDHTKDPIVYVKFLCPWNQWAWFVIEGEKEGDDFKFFGYIIGYVKAWGYFSFSELLSIEDSQGVSIERDKSFLSKPISQIPEITSHTYPPKNGDLYSFERL
jgi:hypothetical protein